MDTILSLFEKSVDYYLSFGGALYIHNGIQNSQFILKNNTFISNQVKKPYIIIYI